MVRRRDGRVQSLLFDSSPLLPSAVFVDGDERLVTGRDALESARTAPARLEPHPKRRVDDGTVLLGDREWRVVDLFAAVLERVRRECVQVMGEVPQDVAVTHPAVWGAPRREVLRKACGRAGLSKVRLVPEPVAAAYYLVEQLDHAVAPGTSILVYDFGAGTFDVSVVTRRARGFDVTAASGLDELGGIDIDAAIAAELRERVGEVGDWNWFSHPGTAAERRGRHDLDRDIRLAKERLSRQTTADLYVPILDRDVHLTRAELETLARPLLDRAVAVVRSVVEGAGVRATELGGIFLVGGASRMPLVATLLHRELGIAPIVVDQLEQVVAHGALSSGHVDRSTTVSDTAAVKPPSEASDSRDSPLLASRSTTAPVSPAVPAPAPERATTPGDPEPVTPAVMRTRTDEDSPPERIESSKRGSDMYHADTDPPVEDQDDAQGDGADVTPRAARLRRRVLLAGGLGVAAAVVIPFALSGDDPPARSDDTATSSPSPSTSGDGRRWASETFLEDVDVRALALSPDGSVLAFTREEALELWNTSGEGIDVLPYEEDPTAFDTGDRMTFHPDGDLLAVSREGVGIWEVSRRERFATLEGDRRTPMAFSPDGRLLAFGRDDQVLVWDVTTRTTVTTLTSSAWEVTGLEGIAFSPDGIRLATVGGGLESTILEVWDTATWRRTFSPEAVFDGLGGAVAFSPDGSLFAVSGLGSGRIQLYEVADWKRADMLEAPGGNGNHLQFSHDGAILASNGRIETSGRLDLWDMTTRQRFTSLPGSPLLHRGGDLTGIAFSPDGVTIVTANDSSIELWKPV
ncbi:Hsp70 family protein [Stackebrandtia albiflava]|uniref:Hsp70 family protein n=1 Tax=Stackebrandtia albiflava TaxID=406432 RepID=UPI0013158EA6|nr:Hsp70 family protein [Stackebrandtia albiflava]